MKPLVHNSLPYAVNLRVKTTVVAAVGISIAMQARFWTLQAQRCNASRRPAARGFLLELI